MIIFWNRGKIGDPLYIFQEKSAILETLKKPQKFNFLTDIIIFNHIFLTDLIFLYFSLVRASLPILSPQSEHCVGTSTESSQCSILVHCCCKHCEPTTLEKTKKFGKNKVKQKLFALIASASTVVNCWAAVAVQWSSSIDIWIFNFTAYLSDCSLRNGLLLYLANYW
jgi:hypothetical protein